MAPQPSRDEQIIHAHARLIVDVVRACENPALRPPLEPLLNALGEYGQQALVGVIRKLLAGNREPQLLNGLDEDDRIVVEAMLRGLQNPATLPDPNAEADASAAAPGLASMIHAAAAGNIEALHALAGMAEQMTAAGGDMARLGGIMRRLVNGERDPDTLCKGMGARGESLVLSILAELGQLEVH